MKKCQYYPCHRNIENMDCKFCYCPAYPCKIKDLIKYDIEHDIWDCSNCTLVHDNKHVGYLLDYYFSLCSLYLMDEILELYIVSNIKKYMADYIRIINWLNK